MKGTSRRTAVSIFVFSLVFISMLFSLAVAAKVVDSGRGTIQYLDEVSSYAKKHLPLSGVLNKKTSGFWYLKVDDAYINEVYPKIKKLLPRGFFMAPYLNRKSGVGAHISVAYEKESIPQVMSSELGKSFSFEPKEFKIVGSKKKQYAVLVVNADSLKDFRLRAKLSPLLQNHEFHITIAQKKD
ncbi:MAG: hypothetical protein HQK53_08815 [Oligoflexia bacterium]|nr:hypothetical protein [Oligoflexia bacterium]